MDHQPSRKREGRRRGGGGGGGGGSGSRDKQISHALSRLLRHQATNAGIPLDGEGYARLDLVLQWPPLRSIAPSLGEIQAAVSTSDKQRFSLKSCSFSSSSQEAELPASSVLTESSDPSEWLIRANQGHSIKLDSAGGLLKPITLDEADVHIPEHVVHGTFFAFWSKIVESGGLRPMGRNHVHCSTGLPPGDGGDGGGAAAAAAGANNNVISGMRHDAELLIYIDVRRSLEDGAMTWWMSDNGVVLTEGDGESGLVSTKYFKEVRGRRAEVVGTLWLDGEWVADLPRGLKTTVPRGKQRGQHAASRGR